MTDRPLRGESLRQRPVFLERETYRRRRLMDAAAMLPVLGMFLFMIPLLWSRGEDAPSGSLAIFYIFGVWIVLAVLTAVISMPLRDPNPPTARDSEG